VKSAASFRGHPAHVILVDFPIAFWIGSFLTDLAYLWLGDPFWFDMAWYLMGAGIVFAVVAAVAGTLDYFGSVPPHSDARSTARLHGILNGGATILFGFNLWWRTGPNAAAGTEWWVAFGLSIVGVGLISYTGWLGGELVYAYQIGTEKIQVGGNETIYDGRRRGEPGTWVEVGRADELEPGQMKHVIVNGAWLVLAKSGNAIHAIDGLCTHEGGPLCDGVLMDGAVQCPWHGSRFDVRTGSVMAGPARKAIRTYGVKVEGGRILVEAPEGSHVQAIAS
jgi:nitrite reductase/ring-hydroxylating ferredoxin subunit/uncharacterized membrane protein